MDKSSGLRVPYTQQFSPEQTPLNRLIPILRQNAGKTKLRAAVASAFFKGKANPEKLAGNTIIALRSYGILDEKGQLTAVGDELVASQGNEAQSHRLVAQHLLLKLGGIAIVETLREMAAAQLPIELSTIPDELEKRGFVVSKNSSDLSGVLNWLRKAKVLSDYSLNADVYQSLTGASAATLEITKDLNSEQIAFLRAMLALNVRDWTPYTSVIKHAEELYSGQIQYNWKDIVKAVLQPLSKAGLIQIRKRAKVDKKTREGRGGKAADVKPTSLFENEIAEPLLEALYKSAGYTQLRSIRSKSLDQIVSDIKQTADHNKRGTALELLAIRLCQLLDLEFMGWRETDEALAGGAEVDAMLHSSRLIYSRWQVQCKVGAISVEAVAKEVGMQKVTLANVVLLVSTGKASEAALSFRRKIVSTTNLNVIFVDGTGLQKTIKDNSVLVEILRQQAHDALALKPAVGGLRTSPPFTKQSRAIERVREEPTVTYGESPPRLTKLPKPAYTTTLGRMYNGDSLQILPALVADGFRANLIVTSPPFALIRKKKYGNEDAESYNQWFEQFIPLFKNLLEPQGSLVIDIGGAWIKGIPAKSTYHLKLLLRLCESGFFLAQDFYHYNPARLPTPAEWVTIRRLRVKDSINNVWWLALDPFVKVDNRRVLSKYSKSMEALLKNGYKPAVRPSGHDISDKFQKDNGGAIPPNLLEFPNTESNTHYLRRCKDEAIKPHPARFPRALPDWFIRFLTNPGDVVLDPFAGSNVTGEAAEKLGRQWISVELNADYVAGSQFRFESEKTVAEKSEARAANAQAMLL